MYEELTAQAKQAVTELLDVAKLKPGKLFVIGCGRFPDEVLTPLLAYQMNAVKKAAALGAKIACGSDAGAYRVLHGQGGLDERTLLRRAIGEGADTVTDAGNAVIMARF